jgi:hypothetical protein
MGYDLKWLDEDRRILRLRLFDPLAAFEAEELLKQARSIVEAPRPVFVLLDLREFTMQQAMPELRSLIEGQTVPANLAHLEQSRAAVVGGGVVISMGIGMARQMTGLDIMRAFDDEDRGLSWLEGEVQRLSGPA